MGKEIGEAGRQGGNGVDYMQINILGTVYTIEKLSAAEDNMLTECAGYCDKTSHRIVVITKDENCNLDNFDVYQRKVIRHEIIHAFLFESGLHEDWTHENGHDETYVDWIAAQWPKLQKAFEAAGVEK